MAALSVRVPLTRSNFNYTSAAIAAILALSALSWCKAKYGFTGAAKEESRAAHRTTPVGSSASSMRRVSGSQHRQSQQRQRPHHSQSPLYLTPTSDSQYLGSNSSDPRSRSPSPNRQMRSSSRASRTTGITVPTEPGPDLDANHHLKPSSQRSPHDDEHHRYGLPLTITTTSTFDPRGHDPNESHQGSGSSQHRHHKSKRPGLSTTQTSYQSEYSSFRHDIPLYSSSEALSSPPASPSYRLPPWSENQHADATTPDIVVTMPPMNTPNVPEISIAPPTTVSSHDSRTSRGTSDIHIIHDAEEMYHPHQHHHHHRRHQHHYQHEDDRALSSPTSSPPTSSSFRPPNATESIFRDLAQSAVGHRPQFGPSVHMDNSSSSADGGGGGGGGKSGNMMVIYDDDQKEALTKMPPTRPHRKRRPPTPYPPSAASAADTSEPAPTTTVDSPTCLEDSHRARHSQDDDDDDDDDDDKHEHDDLDDGNNHNNSSSYSSDSDRDDNHDDHDENGDEDNDMPQNPTLSSATRPELERRVAVYPILPYMKVHPPHSTSHHHDSKKSKGTRASKTKNLQQQQQQQHVVDNDNDDNDNDNNDKSRKKDGRRKEIDTTMDVDDSYDAEYNHQYPVVSAYQSSHDLFKLPPTSAAAAAAAAAVPPTTITTTTTTTPAPNSPPHPPPPAVEHDHDRASISSLVRGGTSADLYRESLHDQSTKNQAVAKWAQDQARIHQRRMQKRQARAEALQELRKAHAAAVGTSAMAGPAGEALEASVSDGLSPLRLRKEIQDAPGVGQDDQASQAQMPTTDPSTATAVPLKVLLEDNDDHHEKDNGEEDVQALKVEQELGPLEPIDRVETTGAGVGKPY
ncbi:hypothetical protein BGZ70_003783 [Mortierella alpina]|uniref:Uncharacterized protein n=1 Tax=Mortierella alpina TaxID=64518 RepID=A0A9P6JAG9_MORAP|nr:hypothetical protein BGZ70_003783 [Mortierella alpina]